MPTRTNARRTNSGKIRGNTATTDEINKRGREDSYGPIGQAESEEEEQRPRPRKRHRATTKSTEGTVRQLEIKRRLIEMGWTEKDMTFGWWSKHEQAWRDLMSQPKPLTDATWADLEPKIVHLLEINREEHIEVERETRKHRRDYRLAQLLLDMKNKNFLASKFQAPQRVPRRSGTIATSLTHRGPFPQFGDTLEWPVVRILRETDSSVEEMAASFEEHREEIKALLADWKNQVQTYFGDLLREGYESHGQVARPTIDVGDRNSDLLANLSGDLKLLLRADSFFYRTIPCTPSKNPLSYDTILSNEGLTGLESAYVAMPPQTSPDLDCLNCNWYPEAHEAAREILVNMGRPDATYLEMQAVGCAFVCGRCEDDYNRNRDWQEMVQHYVTQKEWYTEIQEELSRLPNEGIIYNNVHDPAFPTDRPMVVINSTQPLVNVSNTGRVEVQLCEVCEKIPFVDEVTAPKSEMLRHLLEVHGISEPKVDEHYTLFYESAPLIFSDSDNSDSMGYSDEEDEEGWGLYRYDYRF